MPSMSMIEQGFCRSSPWRGFARKVILPWALSGLEPHGHLLELGAGSGAMAEGTARTFPDLHLTVTDVDPAMVAAARTSLGARPNVEVEQADVTDLPFADDTFDVVTSYLMLHHVVQWRQALAEASRVLRPGGVFIGYDLDNTRLATWIHVLDRSPYRLIEHHELRPALEETGFQDVLTRRALGQHLIQFRAVKSERRESKC